MQLKNMRNTAKKIIMKQESTYNVIWMVNGVIKEHLAYNKPRAVANWLKRKAETSTHKIGKVILQNNNLK